LRKKTCCSLTSTKVKVRNNRGILSEMTNNAFTSRKDDLVLWQMSNTIQSVTYSDDFEADVLLASPGFQS